MSGATGAIIGSAVVGAGASVYGSRQASGAAGRASRSTRDETARQFDLIRGDTAPYRALGNNALSLISRLYGYGSGSGSSGQPLSYEAWLRENQGSPTRRGPIAFEGGLGGSNKGEPGFPGLRGDLPGSAGAGDGGRAGYDAYVANFNKDNPASSGPDMSAFFESPDYQFNLAEGQKAIDRMASAGGRYNSGATYKAGTRYASGMASQEFGQFVNRLFAQAGIAQTAVGQSGQAGMNSAGIAANAYGNEGNARANAYLTGAAGVNSAVQGGIGNAILLRYLNSSGTNPAFHGAT